MLRIEPYRPADLPLVAAFVAAIQEHERASVPGLKPGAETAAAYAEMIRRSCRRIRICAKAANAGALACYETAGYRPYEVILSKPMG